MNDRDFDLIADEHRILIASHGKAQTRCSNIIAQQAKEIERHQGEIMRLRAEVIRRDTQIAYLRAEREELERAIPGLPKRKALARQVSVLIERVQTLMRELHLRTSNPAQEVPLKLERATLLSQLQNRSVLCLGRDEPAARFMMKMVEMAGGRFAHDPGAGEDGPGRIEQSMQAADLVICQAGCISQDAYWRVRDHCRRTGKPCFLVEHSGDRCQPENAALSESPVASLSISSPPPG